LKRALKKSRFFLRINLDGIGKSFYICTRFGIKVQSDVHRGWIDGVGVEAECFKKKPKFFIKKFWLGNKKRCIFAPALRESSRSELQIGS